MLFRSVNLYVDNVLDGTAQLTGRFGIDYIVPSTQDLYVGGDNGSTLYFNGNVYELKIFNTIEEEL